MATIDGLLNGAKKFLADLESGRHPQSVFQLFEKDIVAMNTDDQLFKEGENALGVTIRSYQPYSAAENLTRRCKRRGRQTMLQSCRSVNVSRETTTINGQRVSHN